MTGTGSEPLPPPAGRHIDELQLGRPVVPSPSSFHRTEAERKRPIAELAGSPDRAPLAIQNVKIYPSPEASAIARGTVLVRDGRIVAMGEGVSIPPESEVISGEHRVLTAGFWNAHVHFTEAKWRSVARTSPATLNTQLREMLTSRGFTTVVDAGSDPRVTFRLRRRIEVMELLGPSIYTAGPSVFPPRGIPYYLRDTLPFWLRGFVPQPSTARAAARITERNIARGADLLKLFTGSYVARGKVATMPEPIARAAAAVAHAHGQIVYSHASNLEGTRIAIRSGVDVLAHPPDTTEGINRSILRQMVDHRMAMIPTLKMFADTASARPEYLNPIYDVVGQFRALGGPLLFGTDVGYLTDYSTEDEFRALARSGLDALSVLRMLTTTPAERFGVGKDAGTIAVGKRADLVLLDGDPRDDILAFARIVATVRAGRVVYSRT
jgi:imidazolonepropionase-like amidohydrolase